MATAVDKNFIGKLEIWTEAHRAELIQDLVGLVNIRSVKEEATDRFPFGKGAASAIDRGVELGARYGFKTENDDYYTLSFLRKGRTDRELGILGHIDVVPEGNNWSYEPYNAIEENGYVIGRGSGDNKGPSIAALYTIRALDDLNVDLKHGVRVIWGGNEESGMEDVKHYIRTHDKMPDFTIVCDGEFPVCIGEKGGLSADLVWNIGDDSELIDFTGGVARNAVPDNASIVIKAPLLKVRDALKDSDVKITGEDQAVRIEAKGIAGHASRPEGTVNAIQKLAAAITGAKLLTGKAYGAVKFISEAFSDYYGAGLDIASEDEISGKTTHIGGMIRFTDGELIQNFDSRVAIKTDSKTLVPRLTALAERNGFTVERVKHGLSRYDAPDSPPVKLLTDTATEFLGDSLKPPYVTGGGTHAKYFPNSVPFGAKVPVTGDAPKRYGSAHAADEAVRIDDLMQAIKIYAVSLIRLDELYA